LIVSTRIPGAAARLAVLAAAAGCSFDGLPLGPGAGGIDAGGGATVDAAPAADARQAVDAGGTLDGAACPARERELQLGVLDQGTVGGQSRYEASCAGGPTGPEAFYVLDVQAGARVDLVIDVPGGQPTIDTVLELSSGCSAAGALCSSRGRPGAGEVVVEELVSPGRRYLAVDTLSGSGPFSVTAFLRGVVGSGALCSFDLTTSRCERGEHCVRGDDEASPSCRPLPVAEDGPGNDSACSASRVLSADGAFAGVIDPGTDVDVIAPPRSP
jgi:hypothetical protein